MVRVTEIAKQKTPDSAMSNPGLVVTSVVIIRDDVVVPIVRPDRRSVDHSEDRSVRLHRVVRRRVRRGHLAHPVLHVAERNR